MDCPYENRCLNSGNKCFRCYGESLLKLPEDKIRKKNSKVKTVFKKTVADSDNSWEDLEQTMADKLNNIPTMKEVARRSRGSGNQWFEKGDVLDTILKMECKERAGEKSFSIKRLWLEKAKEEAIDDNKIMALPFRFKGDNKVYIIMQDDDIIELVNLIKAYRTDNESKEQEIILLKEELKKK